MPRTPSLVADSPVTAGLPPQEPLIGLPFASATETAAANTPGFVFSVIRYTSGKISSFRKTGNPGCINTAWEDKISKAQWNGVEGIRLSLDWK
jgi:hypothetical protein